MRKKRLLWLILLLLLLLAVYKIVIAPVRASFFKTLKFTPRILPKFTFPYLRKVRKLCIIHPSTTQG